MDTVVSGTMEAGIWLTVNGSDYFNKPSQVPKGDYAVVVESNGQYFTVDGAGNVRGNPQAVEREALTIAHDTLTARGALGLARLAIKVQG